MRLRNALIALLALHVGFAAWSAPLDGDWNFVESCAGATGAYAQRCKAGERDSFYLHFWSDGNRVCGRHLATAQLGNRVDEAEASEPPSLRGTWVEHQATLVFRTSRGATGEASLEVRGDTLHWKITHRMDDASAWLFLPAEAVLARQPRPPADKPNPPCTP